MTMTTTTQTPADRIVAAVDALRAVPHGDGYAYRDDGTRRWYIVDESDVERYGAAILDGTADYSAWCASTMADEWASAEQIASLRDEAIQAGDEAMADLCLIAHQDLSAAAKVERAIRNAKFEQTIRNARTLA